MSDRHLLVAVIGIAFAYMGTAILGQDVHSLTAVGRRLTPEEAQALENRIEQNPFDVDSRTILLGYYSTKRFQHQSARVAAQEHVLWLILNAPESEVLAIPEGQLSAISDALAYAQGKKAWIDHLKKEPENLRLLENSANFFLLQDRELALESLEKARSLDQENPKWPKKLGQLYALEMITYSLKAETNAAEKALEQFEIAYDLSAERGRDALLPSLAKAAFEANQLQKAGEYAESMLRRRDRGQSFHVANIVLGRIALVDGNIEEARRRLLEAGKTSGSPALDSFGPNMTLAKELLQEGERDVVLEFFELCSEFWKTGREGRLTEWSNAVKEGKIPDFGANLYY